MRRLLAPILLLTILALGLPGMAAAKPAPGEGPSTPAPGPDPTHVTVLKPWGPNLKYRIVRNTTAYTELNARSDPFSYPQKDSWFTIDCQLYANTQSGRRLWTHIPGVGWVIDNAIKTYTDGRLQGVPSCADPGAGHVWFKQPWGPRKEYRVTRDVQLLDRPGGAAIATTLPAKSWTALGCAVTHQGGLWFYANPRGRGAGFVPANAVNRWQDGVPAGLKRCVTQPQPIRTYAAIGDSYSSGLGTNAAQTSGCKQSPGAFFGQLRGGLKQGIITSDFYFQACAGATSKDVLADQLDALDSGTRVVTLTAGGNDFNFERIAQSCLFPGGTPCYAAVNQEIQRSAVARVRRDLATLYTAVRRKAPNAKVYVLGYPRVVHPTRIEGCGALSREDGPVLLRAVLTMNRTIRRAIGQRRGFRYVDLTRTFQDHPACNKGSVDWLNGVHVDSLDKDASFHPNDLGHQAIAARLRQVAPQYFG